MDGLEAVELKLSEVLIDNDSNRFDSEYFKKSYLQEDIYKFRYENIILGQIAFITDGQHGYHEVDDNSNIAHITAKNTRNWFADKLNVDMLAKWVDEKNKRSSLKENDILLSTRGTVGQCSLVTKEILPANIDQDLVRICILDDKLNPYYLLTYFNSKFGQDWTLRNSTGMVQQGITIGKVKNCSIPILSVDTQISIERLVTYSYKKLEDSKRLYKEAEELLLSELGLLDFVPNIDNITIKSFSDSFSVSGRLDSEYYQPKYDDIINKIKNYHNGYDMLRNFVDNYSTGYPFSSNLYVDEGIPLIRITNIKNGVLDIENAAKIPVAGIDLSPKDIATAGDILISMSGTIGSSCVVPDNTIAVVNQRIMRISPKNISLNVFPLLINSIIGQSQLERVGTGGVQTNISSGDILSILVPNLENLTQEQIEAKIKQSFALKEQSKQLLELAKRAVEVAIEESEQSAFKLIGEYECLN